jgi:hypothetical protein
MGFFDFINRPDGTDAGAGTAGTQGGGRTSTRATAALLEVPMGQRDPSWTRQFLAHVADAAFFAGEPAVVSGPDRLPLFALRSSASGVPFPGYVIGHMKDDFLLEHGMGVVINPSGQDADWAFTYGDILNLHLHGRFYPPQDPGTRPARLEPTPEARLPRAARAVLRRFLQDLGVAAPRVLFSAWDHAGPDSVELVFDFAPQEFRSVDDFRYAMSHISWFLPRNYSYSVAGNQARNEAGFESL